MASRPIAVIDAETDPFGDRDDKGALRIPEPFIWGFYDGERYREFPTAAALVEFLRPQALVVYAHNGGKFDYHYLLPLLDAYTEVLIINGRLARFKIGECEFRDSYNILPIPLAGYKKDEFDYSKMRRGERDRHMPEIRRYLQNDCRYLFELVSRFRQEYGNGLTLAGSAMKYWQKQFGHEAPQTSEDFYTALSPYYYGGRVECFRRGIIAEPFKLYDINSAYPYAMLHDHPISCNAVQTDAVTLRDPIVDQSMYTLRAVSRGAFPFREKNKLRFPSDNVPRVYNVTGWELRAALETATIERAQIISRLDFGTDINFRDYVSHFYKLKRESAKESPEYIFAKLFMNSLYGKFGANPENYHNFGIVPTKFANWFCDPEKADAAIDENPDALNIGKHAPPWHDGKNGEPKGFYWTGAGTLGPWALLQAELSEPERRYYNLATAASITGFVRSFLWRHLCKVRAAGGRLLYCDTDSIAFAGAGAEAFALSDELGDWGLDGEFSRGGIAGKKLYCFEYAVPKKKNGKTITHKTASKGVRLTADEIMRVAAGGTVVHESQAPTYSPHKPPSFVKRKISQTAAE